MALSSQNLLCMRLDFDISISHRVGKAQKSMQRSLPGGVGGGDGAVATGLACRLPFPEERTCTHAGHMLEDPTQWPQKVLSIVRDTCAKLRAGLPAATSFATRLNGSRIRSINCQSRAHWHETHNRKHDSTQVIFELTTQRSVLQQAVSNSSVDRPAWHGMQA